MLRFSVLGKVTLHEECQINTFWILWIIHWCFWVPLFNLGLVIVDETTVCAFADHDDAVTLDFRSLNQGLVDTIWSIQLEANVWH